MFRNILFNVQFYSMLNTIYLFFSHNLPLFLNILSLLHYDTTQVHSSIT